MILTHGINSLPRSGGGNIDPDIIILQDWVTQGVGLQPTSGIVPPARFDPNGPLDVSGTGWSGTPFVRNSDIGNVKKDNDLVPYSIVWQGQAITDYHLVDGSTEFTMEAWLRLVTASTMRNERVAPLIGLFGNNSYNLGTFDAYGIDVYNQTRKNPGFAFDAGTWHHIAIVCTGSTILGFKDGVHATPGSLYSFAYTLFAIVPRLYERILDSTYRSPEYDIAQACLTNRAKWLEDFTPPTRPYCLGME